MFQLNITKNNRLKASVSAMAIAAAMATIQGREASAAPLSGVTVSTANATYHVTDTTNANAFVGSTILFNEGGGADVNVKLTITGDGSPINAFINGIDITDDNDVVNDTHTLVVGDGLNDITVNIGNSILGDSGDSAAERLNIIIDADNGAGGVGDSRLNVAGVLDLGATGTITLDSSSTAAATLGITGGADRAVTAIIDGAADGEGILIVTDANGGEVPNQDAFTGAIGGTHRLASIEVGSSTLAGSAKFNSAVSATALTVTGGDHADEDTVAEFVGNLTATSIVVNSGTGDATLSFTGAAAQTIAGTIDGGSAGEGILIISDSDDNAAPTADVFSGVIGGSSALASIIVGTANEDLGGGAATFSKAVSATTITILGGENADEDSSAAFAENITATTITLDDGAGGDASITLNGTTVQTVAGNILAATAGEGILTVNNDATFTGDIGSTRLEALTLAADKTMTIGVVGANKTLGATTATINGNLKIVDSISLTAGTVMTIDNDTTLEVVNARVIGADDAVIDASTAGSSFDLADGTIDLTINKFRNGSLTLVDASDAGTLTATAEQFIIADTRLFDYTVADDNDQIVVTARVQPIPVLEENFNINTNVAGALNNGLQVEDDAVFEAWEAVIEDGDAAIRDAAAQSSNAPSVLAAVSSLVVDSGFRVAKSTSDHLSAVRGASEHRGVSSGDHIFAGNGALWVETFYNMMDQDVKDTISGFTADTYGVVAGADLYSNGTVTFGVAGGYSTSEVDGDGINEDRTDINGYHLSVYGDYNAQSWYVEGSLGYGYNEMETKRHIEFGGLNADAVGDYTGTQITANAAVGVPLQVSDYNVTPIAGLRYAYSTYDPYTEKGAGGLNLTIDPDDVSVLEGSLGGKLNRSVEVGSGRFVPEIRAALLYDFFAEEAGSSSSFAGVDANFQVIGSEKEEFGSVVGAGLSFDTGGTEISVDYDAEMRQDYLNHTGLVHARLKF